MRSKRPTVAKKKLLELIAPFRAAPFKLTNGDIARLARAAVSESAGWEVSTQVSNWLNGHSAVPLQAYELLAAKLQLLREGAVTMEELCSPRLLHEHYEARYQIKKSTDSE